MGIEIFETTSEHQTLFANLYQFYMYDFSEMLGFEVEADGRFEDDDLEGCWVKDWRHAFLLKVDDEYAGLAIVDEWIKTIENPEDIIDMAEFFIMRKFRKQKLGTHFATWLFDQFPGRWRVAQLAENVHALIFWRKVIADYTKGQFQDTNWSDDQRHGTVQFFENRT